MLHEKLNQKFLKDGKIIRWPKKSVDKKSILYYISTKIQSNKKISEKEINEIIIKNISFEDYALIRRELIEGNFLNRTKDCREYWKEDTTQ